MGTDLSTFVKVFTECKISRERNIALLFNSV